MAEITTAPVASYLLEGDILCLIREVNGVPTLYQTAPGVISAIAKDAVGNMVMANAPPTTDPGVKNALWQSGGVLLVSQGS